MALYLKYRPQSFADVVGQDHVVTTLEHALERGQTAHAYLLSGTRGTGKTSVARLLAKAILLQGIDDPTLAKHVVKAVEDGSLIDLIEIDAASNRGIDDIRDLIEKVGFSPSVSKAKVYIIDEVHMMTKEAFNALLKTLEEPPEYAYFILATTELHKVPDTIQSRCQRFLFKRVSSDDIIRRLQYIVDQEKIVVDRDALRMIARHATGSFRDGISLLDQLRSLEKITAKDVAERIGTTVGTFIEDLIGIIGEGDTKKVLETVQQIEEANIPLDLVASELLSYVREEMHNAIAEGKSIDLYVRMMDTLLGALKQLRISPVPGLVLEAALLSFCTTGDDAEDAPPRTKRVTSHTTKTPVQKQPPDEKMEEATPTNKAEKRGIIEAEDFSVDHVLKHWEAIVKQVTPPSVRMSLKNGVISTAEGGTLTLSFPSAFHRDKVADTHASRTIEEILQSVFKQPIRITCLLEKDLKPLKPIPETDLAEAAKEVFG